MSRALRLALVVLLWLVVFGAVGAILTYLEGCSSGGFRKGLVTSAELVKDAANTVPPLACGAVEKTCKVNPCPALEKCKRATRLLRTGAAMYIQGAALLNEVVPDE